jgi:hypothetical protein
LRPVKESEGGSGVHQEAVHATPTAPHAKAAPHPPSIIQTNSHPSDLTSHASPSHVSAQQDQHPHTEDARLEAAPSDDDITLCNPMQSSGMFVTATSSELRSTEWLGSTVHSVNQSTAAGVCHDYSLGASMKVLDLISRFFACFFLMRLYRSHAFIAVLLSAEVTNMF